MAAYNHRTRRSASLHMISIRVKIGKELISALHMAAMFPVPDAMATIRLMFGN